MPTTAGSMPTSASESPSLRELEEAGSTFLPHFGSLLQDIFCLLFKYNVIFHKASRTLSPARS